MPRTSQELRDEAKAARDAAKAAATEKALRDSELAEAQSEAWAALGLRLADLMEEALTGDEDATNLMLAVAPHETDQNAQRALLDAAVNGFSHAMVFLRNKYE